MRTKTVCICIVLATIRISAAQQEPARPQLERQDPNTLLAAYHAACAAGDLVLADRLSQQGVQHHSQHRGLWLATVDSALARQNPTVALERCSEAEKSLGNDPELAWRRGQAYAMMGRWVGATQRHKLAEVKLGQFVEGRLVVKRLDRWGTVLLAGEDSAVFAIRLALEGGLNRPEVHLLYARCWLSLGATEEALAIVRRQLDRLDEQADPALLNLAKTLAAEAGELDLLLEVAKRQAKRSKKNADRLLAAAHEQAADIAALRGEIELTYSLRQRAYALQPETPGGRLRLADSAWDAGDRDVAAKHYRAILANEPQHPERQRLSQRLSSAESPK